MAKVLFICLGNTCRSPMAESIFKNLLRKNPNIDITLWDVDSAAIADWNIGYGPESRCIQVLHDHHLHTTHIGRQICSEDFNRFDYIFGMDDMNIKDLKDMAPAYCMTKIELLGKYNANGPNEIPDPYFTSGIENFRKCYELITASCEGFLKMYQESYPN